MDCRVVLEAAVAVYDVSTPEEAIRIAIAKTGAALNPDLSHVDIDTGEGTSPSGESLEPVFVVAGEALVALELEMPVYAVDRAEHAERVARKEIGQRLEDVPLAVLSVEDVTDETDGGSEPTNRDPGDEASGSSTGETADGDGETAVTAEQEEDILPEFEELL